jgi:hypothetical protein
LHDQLNVLDSIWAYKLNRQRPERNIVSRFMALGLDRLAGVPGEEDNEPTGLHMSEGDSSINGLIGRKTFKTAEPGSSSPSSTAKTISSKSFPLIDPGVIWFGNAVTRPRLTNA